MKYDRGLIVPLFSFLLAVLLSLALSGSRVFSLRLSGDQTTISCKSKQLPVEIFTDNMPWASTLSIGMLLRVRGPDDQGNVVQIWCLSNGKHRNVRNLWRGGASYNCIVKKAFPEGFERVIARCVYPAGWNRGAIYHTGDQNGNGRIDAFCRIRWVNEEPERDTNGDGHIDLDEYEYDVEANSLSQHHLESSSPWHLVSVYTSVVDFTGELIDDIIAQPPDKDMGHHSVSIHRNTADLDMDGDVDADDVKIISDSMGSVRGDPLYNPLADIMPDGIVDVYDQMLFNENFQGDIQPPTIHSIIATPNTLYGPAKEMIPVTVEAIVSDAQDPSPSYRILDVRIENMGDDGRAIRDYNIVSERTVLLMPEFGPNGRERTYVITIEAYDNKGNIVRGDVAVRVE